MTLNATETLHRVSAVSNMQYSAVFSIQQRGLEKLFACFLIMYLSTLVIEPASRNTNNYAPQLLAVCIV